MASKSVLLIVDDGLIRWALEKELSSHGLEVHGVESAADALGPIHRNAYPLIFLDIGLPDVQGPEILDAIRERAPKTRIVVLGCDATPAVKRTAFARGAWQFVDKPFDLQDVLGLARSVFGAHSEQRQHERYLCHLPLRVSLLSPPPEAALVELDNVSCTTVNVGPGGMRIQTGYRLEVGQRLQANVLVRRDPCATYVPPEAEAEVVWLDSAESGFTGGVRWLSGPTPGRTS